VSSLRRRRANRRNARASTGPRTAAGKARAAQNARKHGLSVPALRDPEKTRNIGELARKLAGPKAYPQRFAAACRLVAAQIDLLDIREARLPLLSRALEDRSAIKRLHSIDRYARYARSQRSRAIRDFGSARPPVSTSFGQTSCVDSCGDEIDIAAALRKPPLRKARSSPKLRIRTSRGRYLRFGQRSCSTNFNILPKQSQRGKIQIKQRFNMNSARRGR
jgi:hypothetical protein